MADALAADHQRLLTIASAAIRARDNDALWKRAPDEACDAYAASCDRLWTELERQLAQSPSLDGGD